MCTLQTLDIKVCPGHVCTLGKHKTLNAAITGHIIVSDTENVAQCAKWTLETLDFMLLTILGSTHYKCCEATKYRMLHTEEDAHC